MNAQSYPKVETESGWYRVEGDKVTFNNSGYKQTFKVADVNNAITSGILLPEDLRKDMEADGLSEGEMKEWAWKVKRDYGSLFVISNTDEMHQFYTKGNQLDPNPNLRD